MLDIWNVCEDATNGEILVTRAADLPVTPDGAFLKSFSFISISIGLRAHREADRFVLVASLAMSLLLTASCCCEAGH